MGYRVMEVADLLQPDRVLVGLKIANKSLLLAELGRRAGLSLGMEPALITAALLARERLGSTGLGRGFALPHARIDGLGAPFGMLLRMVRPIDFEAIDGEPVDLVFLLLAPADAGNAHLAALSAVSRQMRDQAFVQRVRKVDNAAALYKLLANER